MEEKHKAIIYTRVSTDEQASEGVSLDAQLERSRAYCVSQDYEIVEEISDPGQSAKTLDRPGLQKCFDFLDQKRATILVFYKLDRLTRSTKDLGVILDRMGESDFEIASVVDSLDTGTATGRLQLNIMASISQWERETIVERTKEAHAYKKRHGEKNGGNRPYGYQIKENNGKKILVPDEQEQRMIEKIKDWKESGMSLTAICKELRRRKAKNQSGKCSWHPQTVKRLVSEKRSFVAAQA